MATTVNSTHSLSDGLPYDDIHIGEDKKVYFGESDTYIVYNSIAAELEVWVNGVKAASW